MELPLAEKPQREQVIKKLRVLPRSFEPISIASRREQNLLFFTSLPFITYWKPTTYSGFTA
jgi:hypothetical protein